MKYDKNTTMNLMKKALSIALKSGADHAVSIMNQCSGSSLRFALNQSTQHIEKNGATLTLAVAVGQKEAMIETNHTDIDTLKNIIEQVIRCAKHAPENPEFIPPIPPQKYPKAKSWFDSTAKVTLEDRTEILKEMLDYAQDKGVDSFGNLTVDNGSIAVMNSNDLTAFQEYNEAKLKLTVRTRKGDGSGQVSVGVGDWNELNPMEQIVNATETAHMSINPVKIDPGEYTVILAPSAVLEYIMYLLFVMDAREAEYGQSFFSKKGGGTLLGRKFFDDSVTIKSLFDHPHLPCISFGLPFGSGGSQAGMHFSFGLPMENHTWIENGVLKKLRESPYWSKKKGHYPVGYPFNIVMEGTGISKDDLIRTTKKGVYISSFWYTSPTDMNKIELTGLTRDGVFLIEDGKITQSLANFRFMDSPARSLKNLVVIGTAEKVEGEFIPGVIPYLKIDKFRLLSHSEAV